MACFRPGCGTGLDAGSDERSNGDKYLLHGKWVRSEVKVLMKTLVLGIIVAAVVLFVLGVTVQSLSFLLGAAPVLLVVAVLVLLRRLRGRRVP